MKTEKTCTVCGTGTKSNFCGNCGQQLKEKNTSIPSLIADFFVNAFDLEKSVFAGIYTLISNPKKLVENYYQGNRKYYPSPGKILVYALAAAVLHLTYIDSTILGMWINNSLFEQHIFFWVIFIPLLTLTSYIAFIKRKEKFSKHLISIIYLASSLFIIISILSSIFHLLFGDILGTTPFIFFITGVFIWNGIVFGPTNKPFKTILYIIWEVLIFIVIIAVLIAITYFMDENAVNITA